MLSAVSERGQMARVRATGDAGSTATVPPTWRVPISASVPFSVRRTRYRSYGTSLLLFACVTESTSPRSSARVRSWTSDVFRVSTLSRHWRSERSLSECSVGLFPTTLFRSTRRRSAIRYSSPRSTKISLYLHRAPTNITCRPLVQSVQDVIELTGFVVLEKANLFLCIAALAVTSEDTTNGAVRRRCKSVPHLEYSSYTFQLVCVDGA